MRASLFRFWWVSWANAFGVRTHALGTTRSTSIKKARPVRTYLVAGTTRGCSLQVSREHARPLTTTECWGIVDYKDWSLLDWGWVKETCELGTLTTASTGRCAAIATNNVCGPQFRSMWRDVA